jgi:predicted phosphate transport protein (TIGR00153 family)
MNISKIFQIFVPKDKKFFPLFEGSAENLVKAAETFKQLLLTHDHLDRISVIRYVKELENKGDEFTHTIFNELSSSFITPFDREDIHSLTSSLDDVVDYIYGASQKIDLFKPKEFSPEFIKLSELLIEAAREIEIAVKELRNLKNPQRIRESCIKINSIENRADDVYHYKLQSLFEKEKDAIELIKRKEIIETLEKAIDKAEDVSDVLKTIIIKVA